MAAFRDPGRVPSTLRSPAARGMSPRTALTKVDFPTPLGPRTATNSPGATTRSRPSHTRRPPNVTAAPRAWIAACAAVGLTLVPACRDGRSAVATPRGRRSLPGGLAEGRLEQLELGHLPRLEGCAGRGEGLGDRG